MFLRLPLLRDVGGSITRGIRAGPQCCVCGRVLGDRQSPLRFLAEYFYRLHFPNVPQSRHVSHIKIWRCWPKLFDFRGMLRNAVVELAQSLCSFDDYRQTQQERKPDIVIVWQLILFLHPPTKNESCFIRIIWMWYPSVEISHIWVLDSKNKSQAFTF